MKVLPPRWFVEYSCCPREGDGTLGSDCEGVTSPTGGRCKGRMRLGSCCARSIFVWRLPKKNKGIKSASGSVLFQDSLTSHSPTRCANISNKKSVILRSSNKKHKRTLVFPSSSILLSTCNISPFTSPLLYQHIAKPTQSLVGPNQNPLSHSLYKKKINKIKPLPTVKSINTFHHQNQTSLKIIKKNFQKEQNENPKMKKIKIK